MPEKLNEEALRREDFVEGTPVVLADGQAWSLRRPMVRFRPSNTSTSGFRSVIRLTGQDDYQSLIDAYRTLFEGEGSVRVDEMARLELAIGRALLLGNYEIAEEQLGELLEFGYDEESDPEGNRIREEVMACAFGQGPKRSDAGIE